jgi:hypothetical protein
MVVVGDARNLVARRVPKEGPYIARPMVEGGDVSSLDVQRVLKGVQITS